MARRSSLPSPHPAQLSVDDMRRGLARLRKRIADVEAFDPEALTAADPDAGTNALSRSVDAALVSTFGNDTVEYERYRNASWFERSYYMGSETPLREIRSDYAKRRRESLELLNAAVRELEERIEEQVDLIGAPLVSHVRSAAAATSRRVFVVHGHDEGPREAVARFLVNVGLEPVILHERPNKGRTLITKFQEESADIGFAVVLMTPDDYGGKHPPDRGAIRQNVLPDGSLDITLTGSTSEPRVRQNVVFELGFFIGRLGSDRVVALRRGEVEIPSDMQGVVYVDYDDAGVWRHHLARELIAAGYEINTEAFFGV